MSRTREQLTADIIVSLHHELYLAYANKQRHDRTYDQEFGEYVGQQFQLILKSLKTTD